MTDSDAHFLRESTGTSGLEKTARLVVERLADHEIPHLIVGGLAVQEHGYPRVTVDVDLVVPDVFDAVEGLTSGLAGPFVREPDCEDSVRDRRTGVLVNLLPAGGVVKAGCQVPFPAPDSVSKRLRMVSLEVLISLKLDSWANSPMRRLKDKADVVELMKRRQLPRNLPVSPVVRALYEQTWDALEAEK